MPRKTTPTLREAIDEYQEIRATRVAATTLYNDGCVLNIFVRALGEGAQVHRAITTQSVERWFIGESKRQSASSFNKVRTRVKGFTEFCQRRGWLDRDVLGEIRPRRVMKKERLRLSPSELLELPAFARTDRDRALIVLACNTALRDHEIAGLRVRDVDLNNGNLRVVSTKSGTEDVMPITAELDSALRVWFTSYEEDAGRLQADWFLFPRREPGAGRFKNTKGVAGGTFLLHEYGVLVPDQPITKMAVLIQRALTDAGHVIERGEGVHTLRRSVARAYFDARVSAGFDGALRETSALLHHTSTQTTEIYLGLTTEKLGRDKALRGKPFLSAMVEHAELRELDAG